MSPFKSYRLNRKKSWFKKCLNSYLTPRFLYPLIYSQHRWRQILELPVSTPGKVAGALSRQTFFQKLLLHYVWFWPRDRYDINDWLFADLGTRKEYSKYIALSAADKLFCDLVESYCPDKEASILELGSNVGRVLNELVGRGYKNLQGVELNHNAVNASESVFGGDIFQRIERNAIQAFLTTAKTESYSTVITFGATIELIHPAFDVIGNMCRVARDTIVIYVNENQHTYPRFYITEFERHGFYNLFYQRAIGEICDVNTENSLMVFKRI